MEVLGLEVAINSSRIKVFGFKVLFLPSFQVSSPWHKDIPTLVPQVKIPFAMAVYAIGGTTRRLQSTFYIMYCPKSGEKSSTKSDLPLFHKYEIPFSSSVAAAIMTRHN